MCRETCGTDRVRSKRMVLTPLGWRQGSQVLQRRSRDDGDKQSQWLTGENAEQPYKPLRREGRCYTACTCGNRAVCATVLARRPRVQRSPGLPCALFTERRDKIDANLGVKCAARMRAHVHPPTIAFIVIARSNSDEAIQSRVRGSGLLRFARNDETLRCHSGRLEGANSDVRLHI